jgi:putative addiction module component (TIGR02574 family)
LPKRDNGNKSAGRLSLGWICLFYAKILTHVTVLIMATQTKKILDEALGLSESERASLAASLIDSLDSETDSDVELAWEREFDRRLRQLDATGTTGIPWTEARKKLLESLG